MSASRAEKDSLRDCELGAKKVTIGEGDGDGAAVDGGCEGCDDWFAGMGGSGVESGVDII